MCQLFLWGSSDLLWRLNRQWKRWICKFGRGRCTHFYHLSSSDPGAPSLCPPEVGLQWRRSEGWRRRWQRQNAGSVELQCAPQQCAPRSKTELHFAVENLSAQGGSWEASVEGGGLNQPKKVILGFWCQASIEHCFALQEPVKKSFFRGVGLKSRGRFCFGSFYLIDGWDGCRASGV